MEVEQRPSPPRPHPLAAQGRTGTEKLGTGDPTGAWGRGSWGVGRGGGPGGPGVTRGQSAMIFQFGWLNRVRAERGAEGTPCPAARALEGHGAAGATGAGSAGRPPGEVGSCRPAGPGRSAPGGARGGQGVGVAPSPGVAVRLRREAARPREMWGCVRREKQTRKKKPTKNIYGGNELFFFH